MPRLFVVWLIVAIIIGGGAGWLTAPRHRPVPDCGEARLRERAEQYYRAQRTFDFWTMARMTTPAMQVAEAEELKNKARETAENYRAFKPETIRDHERSAEEIKAELIEVEIDGDWAITKGETIYYVDDMQIPLSLSVLAWVRDAGEWWVYEYKYPEMNAYGIPSNGMLEQIKKRNRRQPQVEMAAPDEMEEPVGEPADETTPVEGTAAGSGEAEPPAEEAGGEARDGAGNDAPSEGTDE